MNTASPHAALALHQKKTMPIEIVLHIIGFCVTDPKTVYNCLPVRKTWSGCAREVLLQDLCLTRHNKDSIGQALTHLDFAKLGLISSITLTFALARSSRSWVFKFAQMLKDCRKLNSLSLNFTPVKKPGGRECVSINLQVLALIPETVRHLELRSSKPWPLTLAHYCNALQTVLPQLVTFHTIGLQICCDLFDLKSKCPLLREVHINGIMPYVKENCVDMIRYGRTHHVGLYRLVKSARYAIDREQMPLVESFTINGRFENSILNPYLFEEDTFGSMYSIDVLQNKSKIYPHIFSENLNLRWVRCYSEDMRVIDILTDDKELGFSMSQAPDRLWHRSSSGARLPPSLALKRRYELWSHPPSLGEMQERFVKSRASGDICWCPRLSSVLDSEDAASAPSITPHYLDGWASSDQLIKGVPEAGIHYLQDG